MRKGTVTRAMVAAMSLLMLSSGAAWAGNLQTDATLSSIALAPTNVVEGSNAFQIKVWATGNIQEDKPGTATIVTSYSMATTGAITANAASELLTFEAGYNYTVGQDCSADPALARKGCQANPFVVNATLSVASGTSAGTTGTLTVSNSGSSGLDADLTPDTGAVQVVVSNLSPSVPGAPARTSTSSSPNQGAFTLEWTASTDDGKPAGSSVTYELQHKDGNDAGWSTVASGLTTNSYSFTGTSAEGEGTWTYQVRASDGTLESAYSAASSAVVVDTTAPSAPTATPSGTSGAAATGATWYKDTVTVTYSGSTDPLLADGSDGSGVASYRAPDTFTTHGANAFSGTATDAAGNVSLAATGSVNVDTSNPAHGCNAAPTTWSALDIVIDCTPTDTGSGLIAADAGAFTLQTSVPAGTETNNASTDSRTISDRVGHQTTAGPITGLKVDKKAPVITPGDIANTTWRNSSLSQLFQASDGGSGLAANQGLGADNQFTLEASAESSKDASGVIVPTVVSRTVVDNVGHETTRTLSARIDLTDPDVALVGGPADGQTYDFGSVPAAPTCNASDDLSGLNEPCAVTGYSNAVGTHTVTATATDIAGNENTDTRTYTVAAWTLKGFYSPVDIGGVYNLVKSGSTVPLKFEVFSATTELTDVASIESFKVYQVATPTDIFVDDIEQLSTGGTSLRYDSTGGQFIQNWQTPKNSAGKAYKVVMTTDDGSTITAYFLLK